MAGSSSRSRSGSAATSSTQALVGHWQARPQTGDWHADRRAGQLEVGSASPLPSPTEVEIRGRDLVSGLPKTITIGSEEVREALDETVIHHHDAVKDTSTAPRRSSPGTSWIGALPLPRRRLCCKDWRNGCAMSANALPMQSHP